MKKLHKAKKINFKKEYAKKYLLKYIKELKVHFDLSDNEIRDIIKQAYYSNSLYNVFVNRLMELFK
ncbi:TPA: hypothetical protein IAA82_03065 [Candidatus Galligastranaerophilus gallistercoris]|nr:hypothetical protein [Candidatus Galligastranaerophilus gallistercoris]